MSTESKCEKLLKRFRADVHAGTASLSNVILHKIKDDKIIFIDTTGSKFSMHISNIDKITLTKAYLGRLEHS